MVEEYLKPDYAPEAVAARCGVPAPRIRALAAELAEVAFDQAITLDQPWTDFRGERACRHARAARSASTRCAGISAHSNGFQTARALHLLQILLGVGGNARRLPAEAALSEADRGASDAAFRDHARASR